MTQSSIIAASVLSLSRHKEEAIVNEIQSFFSLFKFESATQAGRFEGVLFVDGEIPNVGHVLKGLNLEGKVVFLILDRSQDETLFKKLVDKNLVDDLVLKPYHPADGLSKAKHVERLLLWQEVKNMNASLSQVIGQLKESVDVAERLQVARLPERFQNVSGLEISQRYLAGLRSGGDSVEVAESRDQTYVSFFISDASTYGLSSAVLNAIVRATANVAIEGDQSCGEVLFQIQKSLITTLGSKEKLSVFYGVFNRQTLLFRYVSMGNILGYVKHQSWQTLNQRGTLLSQAQVWSDAELLCQDEKIQLHAGDELLFVTDGFQFQGFENVLKKKTKQPRELLNEFALAIKSNQTDELPEQDCTALHIRVQSNVVPLKRVRDGTGSSRSS